jgi:CBS domain-containing protein
MANNTLLMATTARLNQRRADNEARATANKTVRGALVSLAGLLGGKVTNQAGEIVGRVVDVVARLYGTEPYPPVTGLVIRVGHRRSFISADQIATVRAGEVALRSARLDLRDYERRPGEALLARDVLDHQLVDTDGIQVTRAADLYLAPLTGRTVLVGVDVSLPTLIRRLGPRRWQAKPTPDRVLDWQSVAPFAEDSTDGPAEVRLRASRAALHQLRPADLADLLEDLGRIERQQLLEWLPAQAARLIGEMEADEAADALRDLNAAERDGLLARMPAEKSKGLRRLLAHPEDTAGGAMTPYLVTARTTDSVAEIRAALAAQSEHRTEIDAVAVLDEAGRLLADIALFHLAVAEDSTKVGDMVDWLAQFGPAVTVQPETRIEEAAEHLVASRASSLLVVDADNRPVGRILADDVLDSLLPERGRVHFRRFLQ